MKNPFNSLESYSVAIKFNQIQRKRDKSARSSQENRKRAYSFEWRKKLDSLEKYRKSINVKQRQIELKSFHVYGLESLKYRPSYLKESFSPAEQVIQNKNSNLPQILSALGSKIEENYTKSTACDSNRQMSYLSGNLNEPNLTDTVVSESDGRSKRENIFQDSDKRPSRFKPIPLAKKIFVTRRISSPKVYIARDSESESETDSNLSSEGKIRIIRKIGNFQKQNTRRSYRIQEYQTCNQSLSSRKQLQVLHDKTSSIRNSQSSLKSIKNKLFHAQQYYQM